VKVCHVDCQVLLEHAACSHVSWIAYVIVKYQIYEYVYSLVTVFAVENVLIGIKGLLFWVFFVTDMSIYTRVISAMTLIS